MSPEGANHDEDIFSLGVLNVGNVVELDTRLPGDSTLAPFVRVLDASGNGIADEDGDPTDGHFQATIAADGTYYALISSNWIRDGHAYRKIGSLLWEDAEAYAQSLGAHLVTIDDAAEEAFVYTNFGSSDDLWLGMNDAAEEGTWVWADGSPVTYTNWYGSEPNSGNDYDYAYLHDGDGLWRDGHTTWGKAGLVEWVDTSGLPDGSGPGTLARYLLDVDISDPVPPQVTDVSRIPAEGGTTGELLSTFQVTVSEELDAETVNTPIYDYVTYGGHTYVLTSSMTWANVAALADDLGGHVVTVDDQAEQDFLYSTFGTQDLWIGINDAQTEGTWVWADGTPVDYTHWAGGEPNSGDNYDYGYLHYGNGLWYDGHYSWSMAGVIELDSDGTSDVDSDGIPDVVDSHPTDAWNGWDLREAGADGLFDTADDDIYDLRVSPTYSGGTTINLRLFDGPMHAGHYRLTITPSLQDPVGNSLDGNGDGTGGDAYVRTFYVDLLEGFVLEGRDNDTLATATPLPLTEDPAESGYLVAHGLGSIDPAVPNTWETETDYWSFAALAGDKVAVSVDTPASDLDSYVWIYNASGGEVAADNGAGPDADAYISYYTIPSDGTYYVRVGHYYYSGNAGELPTPAGRGARGSIWRATGATITTRFRTPTRSR